MLKGPRSIGPIQKQQRPKPQGLGIRPVITNAMWNDHITRKILDIHVGTAPFAPQTVRVAKGSVIEARHLLRSALHYTRST